MQPARITFAAMAAFSGLLASLAVAQELPRLHFKVLIQDSPSPQVKPGPKAVIITLSGRPRSRRRSSTNSTVGALILP